jgi:hypothetical protein
VVGPATLLLLFPIALPMTIKERFYLTHAALFIGLPYVLPHDSVLLAAYHPVLALLSWFELVNAAIKADSLWLLGAIPVVVYVSIIYNVWQRRAQSDQGVVVSSSE